MKKVQLKIGGKLKCGKCDYERVITSEWIESLISDYSLGNSPFVDFSQYLPRLKCSKCGAKKVVIKTLTQPTGRKKLSVLKHRDKQDVIADQTNKVWRKKTCPACGGHGLEGRCYQCLGSGWVDE